MWIITNYSLSLPKNMFTLKNLTLNLDKYKSFLSFSNYYNLGFIILFSSLLKSSPKFNKFRILVT